MEKDINKSTRIAMTVLFLCFLINSGLAIYAWFENCQLTNDYNELNAKFSIREDNELTDFQKLVFNEVVETYEMCGDIIKKSQFGIDGIYWQDRYYCVWTKGETPDEVASTEEHEKCHDLVYKKYEHFCENE